MINVKALLTCQRRFFLVCCDRTDWEYQFTLISETISLIVESLTLLPADSSIKLSYCGLERAIVHLKERFAVDTLEIKVVQPKPKIVRRQEGTTI